MSQEIQELLHAAKQDAPPMRRTVDDIVAGGRRRQARRRRGWTSAAAVAVALAVAAAITVPQVLVGRHPAGHPSPAPTHATKVFNYTFDGYTVGQFKVTAPFLVTPGYQQAYVRKSGEPEYVHRPNGVYYTPGYSAVLTVYRPGAYDPIRFQHAEPVTVNGRPGFYGPDIPARAEIRSPTPAIAWQYATDAWAVIAQVTTVDSLPVVRFGFTPTIHYSKADLMSIADAFTGSPAHGATVAFKTTWVPVGYRATQVIDTLATPSGTPFVVSSALLVAGQPSYARLTQAVDFDVSDLPRVTVVLYPARSAPLPRRPDERPGGPPECLLPHSLECYVTTPDGNYVATVRGGNPLSRADIEHILTGLKFANVSDPATWFPVADAVPGGTG